MVTAYHIGLHKTASTWLQQIYFSQHPQLCLLNKWNDPWNDAFLHYLIVTPLRKFDTGIAKQLLQQQIDEKAGTAEDRKIIISAERLSGHPYSGGRDRFEIGERIKQISPDAKILIFVRDQISMFNSLYKQMVYQGYTGTIQDLMYRKSWLGKGFDLSFLEYDTLISFYMEMFGRENVFVCRFENFLRDQKKVLFAICDFLEIEHCVNDEMLSKKLGQRSGDRTTSMKRILNKFKKGEYVDSPVFLLNPKVSSLLCKFSAYLNLNVDLNDNDRHFLENHFELSNRRLDKLLQR